MFLGVYCMDLSNQRQDEYAIGRFSDPTGIHTLRKCVGQAKDKTSVETAIAKQ